jgi:hypothetical protein
MSYDPPVAGFANSRARIVKYRRGENDEGLVVFQRVSNSLTAKKYRQVAHCPDGI